MSRSVFSSKRSPILFAGILIALLVFPSLAFADSPHFVNWSFSVDPPAYDLTVAFKEAGLGANVGIDYALNATATGLWGCVNNGDKHPKAANKEATSFPAAGTATLWSGKNGNITGSVSTSPSPLVQQPAGWSCPSGQTATLMTVTYSNISFCDTTNNVYVRPPAPITLTLWAGK